MSHRQQTIDFIDQRLMTSITTSSLTVDGYEVDNLFRRRKRFGVSNGFMCEYYMKCPVEVLVSFPCLVDISNIVIQLKVSTHRSKDIELLTLYQAPLPPDKSIGKESNTANSVVDSSLFPCKFPKKVLSSSDCRFDLAGKYSEAVGVDVTPDKIVFTNPLNSASRSSCAKDGHCVPLRPISTTRCCSHMVVRIKWATVPVLGSLQVWGTISGRNPKYVAVEVDKLLRSFRSAKPKEKIPRVVENGRPKTEDRRPESVNESNVRQNDDKDVDQVPSEFLDPLTLSIMSVPMLLPSGNTIDKETLDKYQAEEEKYGHLPSDPFTGVVFTASKQPVPNSGLRARLDEYLLKNPHLRQSSSGSTSGYRDHHSLKTTDNLTTLRCNSNSSQKRKAKVIECERNTVGSSSSMTTGKLKKYSSIQSSNHPDKPLSTKPTPDLTDKKSNNANDCIDLTGDETNSHTENMKQSLDLALGKVLSSLPLFKSDVSSKRKCLKCNNERFDNLFKLPCAHILCRACLQLVLSGKGKCLSCHKAFGRNAVSKLTVK